MIKAIIALHLKIIMADAEMVVTGIESTTAMVDQLGKAFDELDSHRNSSLHDNTQWEHVKEHFRNLERSFKEKFEELEEKENAFNEKQSETQVLLAEREAAVAAKEWALLDRLQELKDIAVSVIAEVRKKCKVEIPGLHIGGNKETKVSTITNGDSNAPISASEENFPDNRSGESTVAVAVEDKPRPQLKQLCEQMDAKGLLKFISENQKHHVSLRKELSIALKSASEPARLVLDSLEGFYPPDQPTSQGSEKDAALQALRRNCLILMESAAPLLGTTETGGDNPVNFEIKQQAKAIADEWKPKLAAMDLDASHGNSSEAQAFLQLLANFGIATDFDEDELCKFVIAISRRKQAPELCRSLGLAHKMPGVVAVLVDSRRQLDAVHFAYAFQLTESFPPAPLLKAFLNDLGNSVTETSGDTGAASVQKDPNSQELSALRAVVRCIEDYKLQDEYPLGPLQRRVAQLKKAKVDKGMPEAAKFHTKKPRYNAGYVPRKPAVTADSRPYPHTVFGERSLYGIGGVPERYPYATAAPTYEAPSQASFGQQANVQRAYQYTDERAYPAASYSAPSYGSYMGTGMQTASASHGSYVGTGMESASATHGNYLSAGMQTVSANHGNYMGTSYQSASSNYGNYTGAGLQSSHQSYMQTSFQGLKKEL